MGTIDGRNYDTTHEGFIAGIPLRQKDPLPPKEVFVNADTPHYKKVGKITWLQRYSTRL